MARTVVIDAVEMALRVPADLPDPDVVTVHQVLHSPRFMRRLRRAIQDMIVKDPELVQVTFTLSR